MSRMRRESGRKGRWTRIKTTTGRRGSTKRIICDTVQQAAEYLGITCDAIRFAIQRGLFKPTRLGGTLNLIPREQVETYRHEHLRQQGKRKQQPTMKPAE